MQNSPWSPPFHFSQQAEQWQFPSQATYFFCDLHADALAFLRSLSMSGLLLEQSDLKHPQLSEAGKQAKIVIGGDCFDKGPSNLALFRFINCLRAQGAHLVLLAGNHDIRFFTGLLALEYKNIPEQSHFFTRMGRKTAALFAEIYHTYCQHEPTPQVCQQSIENWFFPTQDWEIRFPEVAKEHIPAKKIHKELRQIKHKQHDFIAACGEYGLSLTQIYQAVHKARALFIDAKGEFAWFKDELKLMYRAGSYLYCHAGIDDKMIALMHVQTIKQINQKALCMLNQGQLFELYYSHFGNVFRTKYRDNDFALTFQGTQKLAELGIFALVNGHRSHQNGQQIFVRQGLLHFECDTQLNANCRKKHQLPEFAYASTTFYPDGWVKALSSENGGQKRFHPYLPASA